MPEPATIRRAREDAREGKSPSTQAGEFVREEFHHVRQGKHGARSAKQAIAIGLSKARRAGVKLPPPKQGKASEKIRQQAWRDSEKANKHSHASPKRSRAVTQALRREGHRAASSSAISRQTRASARRRTAAERSASARKAVRTKTPAQRSAAGRKAARTRQRR
jgi:hypothetical protein